jgi:hypothetical protein
MRTAEIAPRLSIPLRLCGACVLLAILSGHAATKAEHKTWITPEAAREEDPDFSFQGEYRTAGAGPAMGAQVVALGGGRFDVYVLEGGLPGAGWEPGQSRTLLRGERKGSVVDGAAAAGGPAATITPGSLSLTTAAGAKLTLGRVERQSATLGAKPPAGAVVLFDGTSADQWEKGRMEQGHLLAPGCSSKQHFGDYSLHLEFRTPYKPTARGQQRGNSGVYHNGRWETQILDSFGLEGRDNECGGIYSIARPRLNMCLPPLAWQTYDVEFTAARFDAAGKRTAWPRITVRLNGVPVHENLELAKDFTTSAPLAGPLESPTGPVYLQYHDNPVVFRNVWIVPGAPRTLEAPRSPRDRR